MRSKVYFCLYCGIKEPFAKALKCYEEPIVKDLLVDIDIDPYHEFVEWTRPIEEYFGYGELNVKRS